MGLKYFVNRNLFLLLVLSISLFSQDFTKEEYAARRAKFMEKIPDGFAIILGSQPIQSYQRYVQNNDFMYLTGVEIPDAILLVDGIKKKSTLFFTMAERTANNYGIDLGYIKNPKEKTGIEKVFERSNFDSYLNELAKTGSKIYTFFNMEELAQECSREARGIFEKNVTKNLWDGRLTREMQFVAKLKEKFPTKTIADCSQFVWNLRVIKSAAEVELMRKAGKIAVKAHNEMIKTTRSGMFEYELAAIYQYYCKKEGAHDLAYETIICSDKNHPYVHYYKHDRKLQDGDFLVVDVGPDYKYYDIDITVSYPVNGKFTPRQKEIYEAANAIHEACMKVYKAGKTRNQVAEEVEAILTKQEFDINSKLFKTGALKSYLGHFVGMAVHDVGSMGDTLKAGMVIANEPFATFADENLGVRVEDTILITETGCENLTAGIPRTVAEIEAFMKQDGIIQVLGKAKLYK